MDKKNQVLYLIIIVAIIAIILFGSVYFASNSAENEVTEDDYNSFSFFYDETQGLWFTQIQILAVPYTIPFHYHPADLEDIIVEENIENIILLKRPSNIIISVPSDASSQIAIAGIEIAKLTGERFEVLKFPTTSAVSSYVEGLPVANCQDASDETVVIQFVRSNKNVVSSDGRCIILEFEENESIRVADAFAYHLIKIL